MDTITRKCTKCQEVKSIEEFCHTRTGKYGRASECKACRREIGKARRLDPTYREQQNAKARAKYHADEELRIAKSQYTKRHRQDPAVKNAHSEYNKYYRQTAKGREVHDVSHAKFIAAHPEQVKAKTAGNNAIQRGKIPPVKSCRCAVCGDQAQGYHHHSYDPSHWFDVTPVCRLCHKRLDRERDQLASEGSPGLE